MGPDRSPAPGAIGLIGLGEIGQVHAAAIRRSRTARLVAVADTVPERLAPFEAQGVRGYRDAAGREPPVTGAAALESISLLQRIYDTAAVLPGTGLGHRS